MKSIRQILIWIILLYLSFIVKGQWLSMAVNIGIDSLFNDNQLPIKLIRTFNWFCVFQIINIAFNSIFWDYIFSKRIDNKTPVLLKYISSTLLFIAFVSIVVTQVFHHSISGFLAISGGFGIVLGFALQNTINDFFSGIVIHLEKPFSLGDFIMLNNTRLADEPLIGKVVSINWRSTRLQKTDGVLIIVPNNQFTKLVVTNFDLPEEKSRFELEFCVGFEIDTQRVIDIMLTALYSVDGILKNPKPKVKVPRTTTDGVIYQVRFWVLPTQTSPGRGRDNVNRAIINYLNYARIPLANNRTEIYYSTIEERSLKFEKFKVKLILGVPIFRNLSEDDLIFLFNQMKERKIKKGRVIVKEGKQEDSMYVISEGHAEVIKEGETNEATKVIGKLGPGDFFGEMSLVLGEPRSATVVAKADSIVFEISKATMKSLFEKDPNLLQHIVDEIGTRKQKTQQKLNQENQPPIEQEDTYQLIKQKIKALFKF